MNDLMDCGRSVSSDCPFWECCAWGQREHVDIPVLPAEADQ